jgi:tol-pal system protein YbgF
MNAYRLAALGLLVIPAFLSAQKRDDILSIQRDVAQLQDQVKQFQAAQDQKMAALQSLIQQALDASNKTSAAMAGLERTVADRLNDQQSKIQAPVVTLGTKVDQMSDDLRSVRENVAELSTRLANLDNKLADISSAVRTLSTPAPAPPPPGAIPGTAGTSAQGPPPGVSAESLWQNANRDYSSGKDELAMNEFADFVKYFPTSDNAPTAQYYIGQVYFRAKQYDDAAQAFDAVLERYSTNPKTPEALYYKGAALMDAGKRTAAGTEFKEFLERYPSHSLARNAQQHLRELGLSATPGTRNKKR